jgi:hypothetical protein
MKFLHVARAIYNIPSDLILYWAFEMFLGWVWRARMFYSNLVGARACL